MSKIRFRGCPRNGLSSESLSKALLAELLRVEETRVRIRKAASGKPFLTSPKDYSFSISHSNDFFALAVVSKPANIGIDIEKVRVVKFIKIAERFFNNEDLNRIYRAGSRRDQLRKFFEIWTIKEACVKCIGTGMFKDVKNIRIKSARLAKIKIRSKQVSLRVAPLRKLPCGFIGHSAVQLKHSTSKKS